MPADLAGDRGPPVRRAGLQIGREGLHPVHQGEIPPLPIPLTCSPTSGAPPALGAPAPFPAPPGGRAAADAPAPFPAPPQDKIQSDLETSVEEFGKGIAEAEKEREYLHKSVQDVEENMKELLRSSPGLTSSIAGMIR